MIVSVQVFEEVSTLLGDEHQGEIQLSTSSSAIRIIRTKLSRMAKCMAALHTCGDVHRRLSGADLHGPVA